MNRLLLFFFCMFLFVAAKGQRNFAQAIKQGDEARDNGKYGIAINKYFAAEAFDPSRKNIVKLKVDTVFNLINKLKIEAENALIEAKKQTKIARSQYFRSEAKSVLASDPTLALRLYEQAILNYKSSVIEKDAYETYLKNSFYKVVTRYKSPVSSVAFSLDAETILVGYQDSLARLCTPGGKIIKEFNLLQIKWPTDANLHAGEAILNLSNETTFKLSNFNGIDLRKFKNDTSGFFHVAISPEGKMKLVADGIWARLLNSEGIAIDSFQFETQVRFGDLINVIAFSPDGKTILVGRTDGGVSLIGILDNKDFRIDFRDFAGETFQGPTCAAFSPDGKTILMGYTNDIARLWDLNGNIIGELKSNTGEVNSANIFSTEVTSVAFSPSTPEYPLGGNRILTGYYDGSVRLWDLKGIMLQEFKGIWEDGCLGGISSISFSYTPKGETLSGTGIRIGLGDGTIRYLNLDGTIITGFKGIGQLMYAAAFSDDGEKIVLGSYNGSAIMFDFLGNQLYVFEIGQEPVNSVAFSPDGKTLFTGCNDGTAVLWSIAGEKLQEFKYNHSAVRSVAFSLDGKKILIGYNDGQAILWNLNGESLQKINSNNSTVNSVAFSPDGKTILTGSDDGTAILWDLKGNLLKQFKNDCSVTSVAFASDGKSIFTGLCGNMARLWDLMGHVYCEFNGPPNVSGDGAPPKAVISVAFSADNKMILTGNRMCEARLWAIPMPLDEFLKSDKIEPLSSEQKKQYGIK